MFEAKNIILGNSSLDMFCEAVFWELNSRKTVYFSEKIVRGQIYLFSRQMKAIVYNF